MLKKLQHAFFIFFSILNVVLVFVMIATLIVMIFRHDVMKGVIEWFRLHVLSWGSWNYLIVFGSALVESFPFIGSVFPGINVIILVGGFFVAGHWSTFPGVALLAFVGAFFGNALGYLMGRYGDPEVYKKYSAFFGAGPTELDWLEKQIRKNGFWFILVGKFNNLLRSFVPFIAGANRMSSSKFWFANTLGSLLWSVTFLLVGVLAIENYETILNWINWIMLGVFVLMVISFTVKNRKHLKKQKHA